MKLSRRSLLFAVAALTLLPAKAIASSATKLDDASQEVYDFIKNTVLCCKALGSPLDYVYFNYYYDDESYPDFIFKNSLEVSTTRKSGLLFGPRKTFFKHKEINTQLVEDEVKRSSWGSELTFVYASPYKCLDPNIPYTKKLVALTKQVMRRNQYECRFIS